MKEDSGFWVEETKDQFSFPLKRKRSFKSKKLVFVGWGSKPLIEFLQSIGRETSREYSRHEVNGIILDYVNSNNLLNPQKKKRILCDERLKTLFGKKSIPRIKIYDLLEVHFIENRDDSDEENSLAQEDAEEGDGYLVSKERKTSIPQKRKVQEAPKSCFAALTSQNIKLIYLKRTLLQSLLKSDERFEDKVVGSFVRIKSDPNDFLQKNSHQLQQVTGVKKTFGSGDAGMETYLQLSNWTKDVLISSLSDDDFSEEECEDLHGRVKAGLLKRLTVVELELKAHVLHEDMTEHWIDKEIKMLQRRIDHANEKGWRRELYEYLQKRQLLMTKSEQERLLSEKPKVVAEELEPEATKAGASERDEEKSGSPEPEQTRLFGENLKVEAKEPEKETMPLDAPEEPEKETMPLDAPEKPGKETMHLDAPEKREKETMPLDASKEVGAVKCFTGSTLRGPSDLLAAGEKVRFEVCLRTLDNSLVRHMDSSKDPTDNSTTQGTGSTQDSDTIKTRGATHMKKVIQGRVTSGKKVVQFDGGHPVGLIGAEFKSYVALAARVNIQITIESWLKVPDETKDLIWEDILSIYDIPNTNIMKERWIQYVGQRWKDFKTKLVSKYIYGTLSHKNPCEKYSFLDQETWNEFVKLHTGPEYEAKRKKHQEIQAKNVHPHSLSRGGYQRLKKVMMDEKMKEQQEIVDSDPSHTISPPSPCRHEKWKRARIDKSGNFRTEATRIVAEKMDSLELQASQGEFVASGRHDILSVALGTDEHPGRVRGMGRGHGIKSVFGHAKRPPQMPTEAVKQMVDSAVAAVEARFETRIAEMMKQFSNMQTPLQQAAQSRQEDDICEHVVAQDDSQKSSSPDPFVDLPTLGARCQLYLEDPIRHLVGFGIAYTGGQVNGVALNANQVKVCVDKIIDSTANVPFPTSEVQLLDAAFQHFIVWPKNLVELCTQADKLKGKTKLTFESVVESHHHELTLADPNSLSNTCKKVYKIACSLEHNLVMHMPRGVVGNIDYELQLESLEIMRFLNMETLDISLFQFFIRSIYKDFGLASKSMYGFLDPNLIQPKMMTRDERITYINDTMQYGKKNCYLAPYVFNGHWVLIAICPLLYEIYWFDSIGREPCEDIKEIIETCVKTTNILSRKKASRQPKSIICSCAIQRRTTECGYYVMKFMLEIISSVAYKRMDKNLERQGRLPYNQQDIDEVRDIWCKFFIDEWVDKLLL
ncbi:uncharacterized protein LOC116029966 isoform X2 [Ipomoea triloba]|uniref:uncharacterized protein LOC116029966 isoform X2 n=1 Tax=Ipomoea triloba TaxID=35885 RepID=UPI00125DBD3F|nr:uncharacterized protein LOC116029966 isoform X2 [Ipomoea triloba]